MTSVFPFYLTRHNCDAKVQMSISHIKNEEIG